MATIGLDVVMAEDIMSDIMSDLTRIIDMIPY